MLRRFSSIAATTVLSLFSTGAAPAQSFELLHEFRHTAENPETPVLAASDGNLYVTTFGGGDFRKGSIQKLTPNGSGGYACELLHSFDGGGGSRPRGGLIEATDGLLYGLTWTGGSSDLGTAYRISTTGDFELLHSFSENEGSLPFGELVQAADGNFYGTASSGGASGGTVFRMDSSGNVALLYAFTGLTGSSPQAGLLVGPDGLLYGTAVQGGSDGYGTLFRIDFSGDFTVLHDFSASEIVSPTGALAALNGLIYGTTRGQFLPGTIFRMDLLGNFSTIHTFSGSDGNLPLGGITAGSDGFLYGTTNQGGTQPLALGTVFRSDADGNVTTLHEFGVSEGVQPLARPVLSGGSLFGTTSLAGAGFDGTVFRLAPDSTLSVLCAFGSAEGLWPVSTLAEASDGLLYGVTFFGGNYPGEGTIFRLSAVGDVTTTHSFTIADGRRPGYGLVQAPDGALYGTTPYGGADNLGAVFKIDLSANFTLLYSFYEGYTGGLPSGPLTVAVDQNLYGSTYDAGPCGGGTIFRLDPGVATNFYDFCSGGSNPYDPLLSASDGNLYGVAGSVFRLSLDGQYQELHHFGVGFEGFGPRGVAEGPNGTFYDTTDSGFTNRGTLFRMTPEGRVLVLHVFPQGGGPGLHKSPLLRASDGNFYGTTSSDDPSEHGEIFEVNAFGDFRTIYSFQGADGSSPTGLIQASDGSLYGTTIYGGSDDVGVAYRLLFGTQASSLSPSSGSAIDPNPFVLAGHGFQKGATVSVGGAPASDVVVSSGDTLSGTTPLLFPGTLNDVVVTNPDSTTGTLVNGWLADFLDVPQNDPFHPFVEKLVRFHIAGGYGSGFFGRDDPVTRAQVAPLLLKSSIGPAFVPVQCSPAFQFLDVVCPSTFADWIDSLYSQQITAGCSTNPLLYCPDANVTRAQVAVMLLKALHGSTYQPPACAGVFEDVPCPGGFAVDWIEQLYNEGITAGCSTAPPLYCPDGPVSRGQIAVFLVRASGL